MRIEQFPLKFPAFQTSSRVSLLLHNISLAKGDFFLLKKTNKGEKETGHSLFLNSKFEELGEELACGNPSGFSTERGVLIMVSVPSTVIALAMPRKASARILLY